MKTIDVIAALGSLAQETRLAVYRLLVKRGPDGLSAGAIAQALDVPASSLSFHLHQLMHAGLISQERQSRQLIYAASYERSDICAVPAASVILENVVAFEVACALVDKFGGDSLLEMQARWKLFQEMASKR